MRKLVLLFIFIAILAPMNLSAQTPFMVASQNVITSKGEIDPSMWTTMSKKYDGNIGFYAWFLAGKSWGEALVGPAFFPAKWAEIDLAVGLETDKNPQRFQGQLWMGNDNSSFLTALEYGGSGFWFVAEGNRKVGSSGVGLGFRAQRFIGVGPRVEYVSGKSKFWVSPIMWDTEHKNATNSMFGLTFTP